MEADLCYVRLDPVVQALGALLSSHLVSVLLEARVLCPLLLLERLVQVPVAPSLCLLGLQQIRLATL